MSTIGRICSETQIVLPDAVIEGQDFSSQLPFPGELSKSERSRLIHSQRLQSRKNCLENIWRNLKIPPDLSLLRGAEGEPIWPEGFAGSITHKKSKIVIVTVRKSQYSTIGIDLEKIESSDKELNTSLILPEGLPPQTNRTFGTLLGFSAKESIYKAQFPILERKLGFSDVQIEWENPTDRRFTGSAKLGDDLEFRVICQVFDSWIFSVSFSRPD